LAVVVVAASVLAACGDDDSTADAPLLSVDQLVARSADTPITVQGFLIVHEGTTRLCAAILESHPPQCGEPAVELVGLDLAGIAGTQTDQGVTWKESVVVTVQRRQDARFDVLSVESEPAG
jgi:hypothetical protein